MNAVTLLLFATVSVYALEQPPTSELEGRPYPADCPPRAEWRGCTYFETPLPNGFCYCPGYGPQRRFSLVIQYLTIAGLQPSPRVLTTANGTVPGPAIIVNAGDWVVVELTNKINTTTTMHWHGMLQVGTPPMDGVPGLTQCLIAPSDSVTYSFRASLPGTYWYHGHIADQYVEGMYGALIVLPTPEMPTHTAADEPLAAPPAYGLDRTLMIADYYNNFVPDVVEDYYLTPFSDGNEPVPDAILVDGKFNRQLGISASRTTPTRLRFVAASALSMYTVSVDGVSMAVVEVDGTTVEPYEVSSFDINCGQRVSVIVDFARIPRRVHGVWIRISAMAAMYPVNITGYTPPYENPDDTLPLNPNYLAWLSFEREDLGNSAAELHPPTYEKPQEVGLSTPVAGAATETNLLSARPAHRMPAPPATHGLNLVISFAANDAGVNVASFNGISAQHAMDVPIPSLYGYLMGTTTPPNASQLTPAPFENLIPIEFDEGAQYYLPYGKVVDILITNTDTGEHPIHIHGHVFWVISTSDYPEAEWRFQQNWVRRDVVSVPAEGWAKIRLVSDNPGVFVAHCHIDFHIDAGLVMVFVEAPELLPSSHIQIPQDFVKQCPPLPHSVKHARRNKLHFYRPPSEAWTSLEASTRGVVRAATSSPGLATLVFGLCCGAALVALVVAVARRRSKQETYAAVPSADDVKVTPSLVYNLS